MSTEKNRAVIESFYEALVAGDVERLVSHTHDDVVINVMGRTPVSGRFVGKEACFGPTSVAATVFGSLLPGARFGLDCRIVAADGPTVVAVNRCEAGTVNGGRYDNTYCQIFTLDDGLITQIDEFLDTVVVESGLFGNNLATPQKDPADPFRL